MALLQQAQPAPSDLEALRLAIMRSIASVVRNAGADDHEVACELHGAPSDLRVVLHGPPCVESVRHALGVRVLDAVHADGRTFGPVAIDLDLGGRDLRP